MNVGLLFKHLESRLDKLEGRKGELSSKDVLSAISEAREDHLRSHMMPSSSLQNDPWAAGKEHETTLYVNEFADGFEGPAAGRSHDHNCGYFLCCCTTTRDYQRMRVNRSSNCSSWEESQYLIDNDELELLQRFDSIKPSNGTIDKTFADNFVRN